MKPPFKFEILAKDKHSRARTGIIHTKHGKLETPYLVPVATRGFIIALTKKEINQLKIPAMLSNTYHLHFMPPGDKEIKKLGGLHRVMQFPRVLFTDSGGFQALSLGIGRVRNMKKIGFFHERKDIDEKDKKESFAEMTEKGIIFKSTYDERISRFMGPRESMEIQSNLGSDIIMAFDQCNCAGDTKKETEEAMLRSHKWELESLKYHNKDQMLYGIVHGGAFKDLRIKSAKFISELPFDGIAVGGSWGKTNKDLYKVLSWIMPLLPEEKPRHLLGSGWVEDIFNAVEQGIDTFDCVETSRIARHRHLYISPKSGGNIKNKFKIKVNQSNFNSNKKIDPICQCPTCKKYTRKQLYTILLKDKREYYKHATVHNIGFMLQLTKDIRESIKQGNFQKLKKRWIKEL
ncbi:hypothetical protein AUJ84_01230 [Candidatus Pacearchaeota archaeon CG1_02_32_132]|nr:MAG: hypothetical protein AUJ84_01230 [Candidatus Pacearchaeota archaeon CG1_02_32_132]